MTREEILRLALEKSDDPAKAMELAREMAAFLEQAPAPPPSPPPLFLEQRAVSSDGGGSVADRPNAGVAAKVVAIPTAYRAPRERWEAIAQDVARGMTLREAARGHGLSEAYSGVSEFVRRRVVEITGQPWIDPRTRKQALRAERVAQAVAGGAAFARAMREEGYLATNDCRMRALVFTRAAEIRAERDRAAQAEEPL